MPSSNCLRLINVENNPESVTLDSTANSKLKTFLFTTRKKSNRAIENHVCWIVKHTTSAATNLDKRQFKASFADETPFIVLLNGLRQRRSVIGGYIEWRVVGNVNTRWCMTMRANRRNKTVTSVVAKRIFSNENTNFKASKKPQEICRKRFQWYNNY